MRGTKFSQVLFLILLTILFFGDLSKIKQYLLSLLKKVSIFNKKSHKKKGV